MLTTIDSKLLDTPSEGDDTTKGDNSSLGPLQSVTEVSSKGAVLGNNINNNVDDFPVTYEVEKRIVDRNNENSQIEYRIHLFGNDGQDYSISTYTQDVQGLADDSIDARGEQLAQEAAQNFYESEQYPKLSKAAPKRIVKEEPKAIDVTPITEGLEQAIEHVTDVKDAIAEVAKEQQNVRDAQQDAYTQLNARLLTIEGVVSGIEKGQEAIEEWLQKLYSALTS